MKKNYYIICYDISCNKKRRKVVKLMEKNGIRVQKSVFDCLITENSFIQLKLKLEKLIDYDTDSLRYYQLCGRCVSSIQHTGYAGKILDEEEEMVV